MKALANISIIGIGPGDSELLTIRAVGYMAMADVVLHPGPRDDAGYAFEVIAHLVRPGQRVRGMALAMKRGPDDGSVGYGRVASALVEEARAGKRAVFLTEGDPMLYGTGSYVAERLRELAPEIAFEVVPGVGSIGAAAAKLGWALARKSEILTVCPATYHADEIGAILDRGGPVCWLKAASILPRLVEELRSRGRLDQAVLVEKVGRPDERTFRDLEAALGEDLSYFSIVLVR